jgi:hypothetical protein
LRNKLSFNYNLQGSKAHLTKEDSMIITDLLEEEENIKETMIEDMMMITDLLEENIKNFMIEENMVRTILLKENMKETLIENTPSNGLKLVKSIQNFTNSTLLSK